MLSRSKKDESISFVPTTLLLDIFKIYFNLKELSRNMKESKLFLSGKESIFKPLISPYNRNLE